MLHAFGKHGGTECVCGHKDSLGWGRRVHAVVVCAMFAILLNMSSMAHGQVVPAGNAGGLIISAGGTGTGEYVQYGERKMVGVTGFVDLDSRRPFGLELEGRWLEWNQTANVHLETYSIGPRYHKNFGNLNPYAKGLIGWGDFNFPYNLGMGRYLLVTAGGGLDYRLMKRVYLRAADVEYQYWPQFTYGVMSTLSVSTGIRVRVF